MKIKIAIIFTFLFLAAGKSIAQQKIYIDENMNRIDSIQYINKCKIYILKCLKYKTDSLDINKVLYNFSFGRITPTEYKQVKKLLVQNADTLINSNTVILINYRDSLYNFEANKKNYDIHVLNHDSIRHKKLTPKNFETNRKNWIKKQNKCIKKLAKNYNTKTFYVYKYDFGTHKDDEALSWIKDRGIFKNLFFKIQYNYNYLIIKPDGEYFLSGNHLSDLNLKSLLKNSDWSKVKLDFQNSYISNSIDGIGIFSEKVGSHIEHCF